MSNPRAYAAKIIANVLTEKVSLNTALAQELKQLSNKRDYGFIQELCYGVLRWYEELKTIASFLLQKPLKQSDQDIYALLLIGFYQLIHMQTPAHAAIHETVQAARDLKKVWATKLINGILRNFQRQQNEIIHKTSQTLSAKYAHPKWLLKKLQQAWPQQWETITAINNQSPPITLRINSLKQSRVHYLQKLTQENIAAHIADHTDNGITLEKSCDVTQLPGFKEGEFSVQDATAQLAAPLLELQPQQIVLDACAAPGGKTTHILELAPDLTDLVAIDSDDARLNKIEENLQRLQLNHSHIKLLCADATQPQQWANHQLFDRILLDTPCSATGVIRRHPDIKFLRREQDISTLATQQLQILNALWPLLKPNGILLYVVCSVLPQEGVEVLEKFLTEHKDAQEKMIAANWGIPMKIGRQILPQDTMDGFYYAKLIKKSD